jgi:uncharacterized protein YegP (UPF0339 family)
MSSYQIYEDRSNKWRWRLSSDEQKITGVSRISFPTKEECLFGVKAVIKQAKDANLEPAGPE